MYQNEYDRTLEKIKTAAELAKDYSNISRCDQNLRYYSREKAWVCLQEVIREYATEIDAFGTVIDGKKVIRGVPIDELSDMEIQVQLYYLKIHIPVYVLLRAGQRELAKQIFRSLQ